MSVRAGLHSNKSEVFVAFLKLGLTSFSGPVVHRGYFRDNPSRVIVDYAKRNLISLIVLATYGRSGLSRLL